MKTATIHHQDGSYYVIFGFVDLEEFGGMQVAHKPGRFYKTKKGAERAVENWKNS